MNPDIAGKYVHETNRSHYLELKPDGSCLLFEGSSGISGTYEIEGSLITIYNTGSYTKGLIGDGVITDAEGDRWVLERAVAGQAAPGRPPIVTRDNTTISIPWLAALVDKNLPWELYEAIGWVIVLIVVSIGAINAR